MVRSLDSVIGPQVLGKRKPSASPPRAALTNCHKLWLKTTVAKNPSANAGDVSSIPGLGRSEEDTLGMMGPPV